MADAIDRVARADRTPDRLLGRLAHTANGLATGKNAGSHLRARFGSGYVSIALTFHHGSLPSPVDVPPADYVEAVLGAVDLETYLLEIHGSWPESVREWLDAPAKTRLIGPRHPRAARPPPADVVRLRHPFAARHAGASSVRARSVSRCTVPVGICSSGHEYNR